MFIVSSQFFCYLLLRMSAVLLACLDRKRQAILFWWQRAGREFRESTRRAVSLVKVNDYLPGSVGRINVQISPGGIGLFAAGAVREDHEQLWLALFLDCIEPVRGTVDLKRDGARRVFAALHTQDIYDWHLLGRIVRLEVRCQAPLLISRITFDAREICPRGIVFVFDAKAELVAALNDLKTQRTKVQHGGLIAGVRLKFDEGDRSAGSGDVRVCRGLESDDAVLEDKDTGDGAGFFFRHDDHVRRVAAEFVLAFFQPEQADQ